MDCVVLEGIEFFAHGGVSEAERLTGQHYRARVELRLDLAPAGASDDIADTVSYAEAYQAIIDVAREKEFRLVEALAERIAARLLDMERVVSVRVEVRKIVPPIDGAVEGAGVDIERTGTGGPS